MEDDALIVDVEPELNAESYIIHYGTESGKYTNSLETKDLSTRIYGLTPGTTYYFNVQAKKGDTISEYGKEVSFTTTSTTTFFDEFETMDKMLTHTSNWDFDSGNAGQDGQPNNFNGDSTRIKRIGNDKNSVASIVYVLPGLQQFDLTVYGYDKSLGTIKMYTSQDGESWENQDFNTSDPVNTKNNWFYQHLTTPQTGVNKNANYIKIEICNHPTKVWAPQLTRFDATMKNSSDFKILKDSMQNDSKSYMTKDIEFTTYMDDAVAKASSGQAELLYSYTNINDGVIIAYVKDGGSINLSTSKDGNSYTDLSVEQETLETKDGYTKIKITVPKLEKGIDYLKVNISKDSYISDISLNYIPENAGIQQIHFIDEKIDGVIDYDITPSIKTAPMNAQGNIVYNSDNDNIVSFKNGVLDFTKQGQTNVTASVEGTDISDTLPVTVYKDIALKKSVTASSSKAGYAVSNAVDGDMDVTRWQSGTEGKEWIQVDLRKEMSFDAIDLGWYSNGQSYDILISNDGKDWTTIQSVQNAEYGKYARFEFNEPLSARYVKVQGVDESQYSLFYFRVLQKNSSEDDIEIEPWNLALNKQAYSSGLHPADGKGKEEKYAVDGNNGTRWASKRSDNEWFYVDLGTECIVQGVNILWEAASAKEFKLQISDDAKTWTDMSHIKNNSVQNDWTRHTFTQDYEGRYVRMQGITANTKYGYSMYEFQVMGTTTDSEENQDIKDITFKDTMMTMLKGQSTTLDVVVNPSYAPSSKIAWKSSDPNLVTVNDDGKITVKGEEGYAVITAYSVKKPEINAQCTIVITPSEGKVIKVDGLQLMNVIDTLTVGDIHQLSVNIVPENATHKHIIWSSSDESVIRVDKNGKLEAIGEGIATITARTTANKKISTTITVKPKTETDKTKLQKLYDEYKNESEENYTEESWQTFEKAMLNAKAVLDNPNATQEEVDFAIQSLTEAKSQLIKKANKTKLEELIKKAEQLDPSDYTQESYVAVDKALENAKAVFDNQNASQEDVDAAVTKLTKAIDGLKEIEAKPEEPKDPIKPVAPEKPSNPDKPNNETDIDEKDSEDVNKNDNQVNTGNFTNPLGWSLLVAGAGIAFVYVLKKSRQSKEL